MGSEAKATLRIGRRSYEGTALLEADELRFRGERRLRIALRDVTSVRASDGTLHVEHANGVAAFVLGAARGAGLTYTRVVRFSESDSAEQLVIPRSAR